MEPLHTSMITMNINYSESKKISFNNDGPSLQVQYKKTKQTKSTVQNEDFFLMLIVNQLNVLLYLIKLTLYSL